MVETIEELDFSSKISKMELLHVLKKEASTIHMHDIMLASSYIQEDAKYMQAGYREEFVETFTKAFITRFKDIREDKKEYKGFIDNSNLQEFLKVLNKQIEESKIRQELYFLRLAKIVSIYTTFILEASIHPVGTSFPGGFKLKYENGEYLCPVKDKQLDTPGALCRFCVSKQDKSV
ncbi:MAG: DUF2115 domain-containing protein [Methanobacterium sp.]|uniref:DUF2115 domain-containing protein n=1 Tax=Methanobacterium sp. TaxID=2164 RepID=UPI003D6559B4|nr:DUF2115 domain-containing protein [Methanobacterium sp.]